MGDSTAVIVDRHLSLLVLCLLIVFELQTRIALGIHGTVTRAWRIKPEAKDLAAYRLNR